MSDKTTPIPGFNSSGDQDRDQRPERSDAAKWRKYWGMENSPIQLPMPYPEGGQRESDLIIGGFRNPFTPATKKKEESS